MRDARLRGVVFGDDEYDFRLGWGEIVELQEKLGCGPHFLLNRLQTGEWLVQDISQIIRLGLVGGGLEPVAAVRLVKRYVEERPPLENHQLAFVVLTAGLMGSPEESVGERKAASPDQPSTTSRTEKSDLPPSTEPARSSATRRKKSTK